MCAHSQCFFNAVALLFPLPPIFKTLEISYAIGMDVRKKEIAELEQRKRENLAVLDTLLSRLGKAMFGRLGNASPADCGEAAGDVDQYRALQQTIAGAEDAIKNVEEQIRRLREVEERIEIREQEDSAQAKDLTAAYTRLGRLLLESGGDFAASRRADADALTSKARSLEDRLAELEQREGNNVFTWIGKNAQGLVLRSFLTKAQDNLAEIYRNAGESFSKPDASREDPADGELAALLAEVRRIGEQSRALADELAALKEERRKISGGFNSGGGPLKQIQVLKSQIAQTQDALNVLYRGFGAEAASIAGAETTEGRRRFIASLARAEDAPDAEQAARLDNAIRSDETAIEKLRAALAIDDEQAAIKKFRGQIADKKARIAEAEKAIAALEASIRDSENHIEQLQKIVQD